MTFSNGASAEPSAIFGSNNNGDEGIDERTENDGPISPPKQENAFYPPQSPRCVSTISSPTHTESTYKSYGRNGQNSYSNMATRVVAVPYPYGYNTAQRMQHAIPLHSCISPNTTQIMMASLNSPAETIQPYGQIQAFPMLDGTSTIHSQHPHQNEIVSNTPASGANGRVCDHCQFHVEYRPKGVTQLSIQSPHIQRVCYISCTMGGYIVYSLRLYAYALFKPHEPP